MKALAGLRYAEAPSVASSSSRLATVQIHTRRSKISCLTVDVQHRTRRHGSDSSYSRPRSPVGEVMTRVRLAAASSHSGRASRRRGIDRPIRSKSRCAWIAEGPKYRSGIRPASIPRSTRAQHGKGRRTRSSRSNTPFGIASVLGEGVRNDDRCRLRRKPSDRSRY